MTRLQRKKINEIMRCFDFKKVHKVMKKLDWKWFLGNGSFTVPTLEQIKAEGRRRLEILVEEDTDFTSCGGFTAQYVGEQFRLAFEITDWDSWDDEKVEEKPMQFIE